MAERPVFFIEQGKVRRRMVEFEWFPGFSVSQKQKSIASFHAAIRRKYPGARPLEISTKGTEALGVKMSAFNLRLDNAPLECVFQSSKVFEHGGPFTDLLQVHPRDAKRDPRLAASGRLTGFRRQGRDWPLEPKTAFYDYIYCLALRACLSPEELAALTGYTHFTDIEFNPARSLNTQARSAAIACLLAESGDLPGAADDPKAFIRFHTITVAG